MCVCGPVICSKSYLFLDPFHFFSIHEHTIGHDNGENIGRGIYPQ